ncbi:T9SS type A sorting domain-containing protein [Flavobacterium sp. RHBU_24]|uniref:T9SS type A sorting domain-containing protein n=1 Tax=Flavobacterium sp. RHBU_24 TaxID=3391185 RepID=UPI0039853961
MKKIYLSIFLLTLTGIYGGYAQIPNWDWMKTLTSISGSYALDVAVDPEGNVITGGLFSGGGIIFDETIMESPTQNQQLFLAKSDNDGNYLWARTATSSLSGIKFVTTDAEGNIYAVGNFNQSILLDGIQLSSDATTWPSFFAKFDPQGNVLWAQAIDAYASSVTGIKISGDYFYLTGNYVDSDGFNLGTFPIGAAESDMFIAKFTLDGTAVWAHNFNGGIIVNSTSVDADALGNVYVSGSAYGNVILNGSTIESYGNNDGILLKFNSDGVLSWGRTFGSEGGDTATNVKADDSGNIYVSTAAEASPFNINNQTIELYGMRNHIISKLDALGNYIWTKLVGGNIYDIFNSLELDSQGGIYATGHSFSTLFYENGQQEEFPVNSHHFVVLHMTDEGEVQWIKTNSVSSNSELYAMAMSNTNELYICGAYTGDINFDGFTANSPIFSGITAKLTGETLVTGQNTLTTQSVIYPNPVKDIINIAGIDDGPFIISDVTGRIVSQGQINNSTINVLAFPSGVYLLNLGNRNTKFIKE